MDPDRRRWVARLRPRPTSSIESLLNLPMGLDVWERHADMLVVAADNDQQAEIEWRLLAHVERLYPVAELQSPDRPEGRAWGRGQATDLPRPGDECANRGVGLDLL